MTRPEVALVVSISSLLQDRLETANRKLRAER